LKKSKLFSLDLVWIKAHLDKLLLWKNYKHFRVIFKMMNIMF